MTSHMYQIKSDILTLDLLDIFILKRGGWIDVVHFLFYAGEAYEEKIKSLNSGFSLEQSENRAVNKSILSGWRQENVFDAWFAKHSRFSYEDLPSDKFGAEFGAKYFSPSSNLTLGEQVINYIEHLKPQKPELAPNYHNLPRIDKREHSGIYKYSTKPIFTKGN